MKTYGLDAPRTTNDEAVELCIHHLRLAWMFYDAVPEDGNRQLLEELSRVMKRSGEESLGADITIRAFAAAALDYHEDLKRQD